MNPTLYDILGVSQDASRDEIRKAWREAADRFEPGKGGSTAQFRLFNEAAEVLLDPDRRKQYDAELTAQPVPEAPMPGAARAATATLVAAEETDLETAAQDDADGSRSPSRVPWPVLVVLGVLAAAAVGLAAFFVTQGLRAEAYGEALDRAPGAAENAAAAVLSYDYKSLEADRDAAAKFLSDDYRKQYVDTFDKLIEKSASESKATVEAKVLASSAMVTGKDRDPDRVQVLLFVNQTTTSSATSEQPSVALNRVRFDMVRADGTWLVDGITSY